MKRALRRLAGVISLAALLTLVSTGAANAHVTSKSINTTTGECLPNASSCGAAVYGTNGFSGQIFGSGSEQLVDFLCVHTPGNGPFVSYGGTYTFTLSDNGAPIGTTSESVTGGTDCTAAINPVTSGSISFTFPNSGVVQYTLSIAGVTPSNAQATFAAYNSIRNEVHDITDDSHARSFSVAPPGPPPEIPEAPIAALLIVSGGLVAAGLVILRSRRSRSPAHPA